jgi:two-component system, response regulator PdtaR
MTKDKHAARAVLVVEDNALLKLFMSDLVVAGGFVALQASNADEAMTVLESRPDVALLVTNVAMRGSMNGVELAHAVDKRWPSVKIIVVSGQPGLSEADLPVSGLFLAKPYHDDELAFEIRALMDRDKGNLASGDTQA